MGEVIAVLDAILAMPDHVDFLPILMHMNAITVTGCATDCSAAATPFAWLPHMAKLILHKQLHSWVQMHISVHKQL